MTLPIEVIDILDRMTAVSGAGRATLIREWLIDSAPSLNELVKAMEMASQNNIDAFKVIGNTLRELNALTGQMELDIRKSRKSAMRKRKRD